jgi:hypothetical protein
MTPIHILFANILVKMFHMSLKYIHVSNSLGHPQVTFVFKESIARHTLSLVLLSMPLYIYFLLLTLTLTTITHFLIFQPRETIRMNGNDNARHRLTRNCMIHCAYVRIWSRNALDMELEWEKKHFQTSQKSQNEGLRASY